MLLESTCWVKPAKGSLKKGHYQSQCDILNCLFEIFQALVIRCVERMVLSCDSEFYTSVFVFGAQSGVMSA